MTIIKKISIALVCICLASCASVDATSTKAQNYSQKLEHVTIQSGMASVNFAYGPIKPSAPFPETFQRAILAEFASHGIDATYVDNKNLIANSFFGSKDDRQPDQTTPRDTLVVKLNKATFLGGIMTTGTFDLSLISGTTKQTVWTANVVIDSNIEVPHWSEATAQKFAVEIGVMLKKDGLI